MKPTADQVEVDRIIREQMSRESIERKNAGELLHFAQYEVMAAALKRLPRNKDKEIYKMPDGSTRLKNVRLAKGDPKNGFIEISLIETELRERRLYVGENVNSPTLNRVIEAYRLVFDPSVNRQDTEKPSLILSQHIDGALGVSDYLDLRLVLATWDVAK